MNLVICGVSGAGKTTIGSLLSEALGLPFYDADDFHPPANIEKMADGLPLDDADRRPWLESLAGHLLSWEKEGGAVLACSALKASYRRILASRCADDIRWIMLHGDRQLLAERLATRNGHFFASGLLETQLAALELPENGWIVDVRSSPDEIMDLILERLRSGQG